MLMKLVNMNPKEGTLMTNHLKAFYSLINWLVAIKMVIDDEMQDSLLC